ncbi:serine/threonine protein kinase [Frankia sp. CcI49]|uniref:serine/threonine-protein kinase n=1 Tax=Frankia sp. CcI49 TaxID=1745382 RepID=UPI0009781C56|nr:serine/threonine-protein kinase [Frankia sp. CcI49]ONH59561.1 serine/threonine protein kinase [Frankia sp. CcI49]
MADRSALRSQGEPLHPDDPTSIGRYEVIGRLGAGGMGRVYLALDQQGRKVAIKVIRSDLAVDPEFRDRFADEVAAARRVAPFCTAQVLDADPHARRPYLVTEFIDGARLDRVVDESGALPLSTLQGVAVGVASALTAIHGAGIVHRDLKPSNVLLSYSGPRVIDFGIARALDAVSGRTQTGLVLGSVGWMAPEQMEGTAPVGPATDVFAWGLLVAYAAAGDHPYGDGTYLEMSERVLTTEPDLRQVPPALAGIVGSALHRDPRRRPSAEQLLLRLLGDRSGAKANPRVAATEVIDNTWPRSRSAAAAAAGLGLGAAAAGAGAGYGAGAAQRPAQTRVAGPGDVSGRWWEAPPDAARGGSAGAGQAYQPGQPGKAVPGAGGPQPARRRKGGFVQYGDEPDLARSGAPYPAGSAGPGQAAPRAARPAPPPAPPAAPYYEDAPRSAYRDAHRPPYGDAHRPAPPAPPPAPEPAPYREPRRPRRRWRLRIPFKRTIIFVLMVLLLLSAADQIATMVDNKRQQIWDRTVTSVHDWVDDQIDWFRGKGDEARDQLPGSNDQIQIPPAGDESLRDRLQDLRGGVSDLLPTGSG